MWVPGQTSVSHRSDRKDRTSVIRIFPEPGSHVSENWQPYLVSYFSSCPFQSPRFYCPPPLHPTAFNFPCLNGLDALTRGLRRNVTGRNLLSDVNKADGRLISSSVRVLLPSSLPPSSSGAPSEAGLSGGLNAWDGTDPDCQMSHTSQWSGGAGDVSKPRKDSFNQPFISDRCRAEPDWTTRTSAE